MKQTLRKTLALKALMLVTMLAGAINGTWAETYKLVQVTSVENNGLYVFEQDGYVMNNTVSSSALQTTNEFVTKGLTGTETYVWQLFVHENSTYYMKNVSRTSDSYLTNSSGTNVSFGNGSYWAFNFQDDGTVLIQNSGNSNRFLGFTNATSHAYKAYATSNLSSYSHAIKVYQLVAEGDENKDNAGLSFGETVSYTVNLGEAFNAPSLSNPNSLTVAYESSNKAVATIDANGSVTILAAGVTTISASSDETLNYNAGYASYTLTVVDPNAPGTKNKPYTVTQARAAIDAGTGITGVYATGIVSKIVTAYNSQYGNISYNISEDGTEEADQLQAYRGFNTNGDWFTSENDVQVGDVVVIYGNLKKYNSTYEFDQGNQLISLVRPAATICATPTFSPEAGTFTSVQSVTISTTTEDATIYYTIDGTDPTTSSTEYTEAISVNETMTIKAIAVKENLENSEVATATYTIDLTPVITAEDVNLAYDATEGEIAYTITNPANGVTLTANPSAEWISDINVLEDKVTFTTTVNEGVADRVAEITLSYTGAESKTISVTQAHYVADYATLPFEFDGGRSDINLTDGLTQEGLDSDYGSSPKLKFNGTGDYLILKFNEAPGKLTFDIKGNTFSDGTFALQTSKDGETYTDVKAYTELGATQNEIIENLSADVRFIKWIYTEKVNGNVALGNIKLEKVNDEPAIIATPTTINVAEEGATGIIEVTYKNMSKTEVAAISYFNAEGEAVGSAEISWLQIAPNEKGYTYTVAANDGAARKVTLQISDQDGKGNPVYSEFITITQDAYVAPFTSVTYTLANAITSGKHYIITNETGMAMGEQKSNNRSAVEVSISEGKATVTSDDVYEVVICGPTADGFYTIYDTKTAGYLYAASSGSNNLKSQATTDANGLWSIEFGEDNVATITAQGNNTRNWMRYNAGSSLFSCYASTSNQDNIYLYEKDGEEALTADYSRNINNAWGTICLPCNATITGAKLYSIAGVDANWTYLALTEEKGTAKAGYPYIFKANTNKVEAFYTGEEISYTMPVNGLYGWYSAGSVPEGCYIISNGTVQLCGNNCTIDANRAYISPRENQVPVISEDDAQNSVKLFFNGAATAINSVNAAQLQGEAYDLTGRRVKAVKGGLYIVNGKKIVK